MSKRLLLLLCTLVIGNGAVYAQQTDATKTDDQISATSILQECPQGANLIESDTPDGYVQACLDDVARQHGFSIAWYENGNKKSQCGARHGKLWGKCVAWREDGKIETEENYRDGLRQGRFTSWFANGRKRCQGDYDQGEKNGRWNCWYPDGRLRSSGDYRAGRPVGKLQHSAAVGRPVDEAIPQGAKSPAPDAAKKFEAWLKEARRVPGVLATPRVLFGKPFLKKSVFLSAPELGHISQITGDKNIIVVGNRGALSCDSRGRRLGGIEFDRRGNSMLAVDIRGDGKSEFMDAGSGFSPVSLFDSLGKQIWSQPPRAYPHLLAAGDLDGDGRLEFAAAGGAGGDIELLDANGKPEGKIPAANVNRLWVLDIDGDGRSEIAWVNRQGQLTVGRAGMRKKSVRNLGRTARRPSVCSFPANTGSPGLLYVHETTAHLVGFDGKSRGKFDVPLANSGWTSGVRGVAVKLRADRPAYMALAVSLRSLWRRSLLVITTPDGRAVYEEILPGNIEALGTAPSVLPGEEILLIGGEGDVHAYGFDSDFYRTAFKRVIDVFRGNPDVDNLLPVKPDNIATEVRDGWWNWTIFIKGPPEALSRIDCVEYKLHLSFNNPLRLVCRRGDGLWAFPLSMGGWGSFIIRVRLFLADGPVQEMTHRLRLWQKK